MVMGVEGSSMSDWFWGAVGASPTPTPNAARCSTTSAAVPPMTAVGELDYEAENLPTFDETLNPTLRRVRR